MRAIRALHDGAATFPWVGREWLFEPRQPVATVCHNELSRRTPSFGRASADKARRFRLLLDAYGLEPDIGVVRAGIARMREFLGQLRKLVSDGSAHEVEAVRRGVLDEGALEIAWAEEHADAIVES